MGHTLGGLNTRKIVDAEGMPAGYACECPRCGATNEAHYGTPPAGEAYTLENTALVWYPNREVGTWCVHAAGCYSGGNCLAMPYFLFR